MKKSTTEIRATLYIVDSSTGALVASTSVTGEATSRKRGLSLRRDGVDGGVSQEENDNVKAAMADAIEKGVKWMAGQIDDLPWRGTVVAVRGEKIYIDRGEREGVEPGLQLTVGESEVIRSHDTGEILDEIVTERGRLEITEVNSKSSVGKVISGDPTLISEGMGIAPAS